MVKVAEDIFPSGPSQEKRTRILIVDDHPVCRKGIARFMANEKDLEVCGEAESVLEARQAVDRLHPDLVLVDLSLKDTSGIELIRELKGKYPDMVFLVLSMHDEIVFIERALKAGSKGYVVKKESSENLISAIHQVLEGRLYLSEEMKKKMLEKQFSGPHGEISTISALSNRELEVFRGIGQGQTTAIIAENLGLSVKTVETYRAKIKAKLGLQNNMELIQYAIRWHQTRQLV